MQIRDIIQEKGAGAVTIGAGQAIHDAINTLNKHRIGALIVTEGEQEIVGIMTERDILRVCGDAFERLNKSVLSTIGVRISWYP